MRIKEWQDANPDYVAKIDVTPIREIIFSVKNSKDEAERVIPMNDIPFNQDELIVEDYICLIFENLKQMRKQL